MSEKDLEVGNVVADSPGGGTIDIDEIVRKYDTEARFRSLKGWQGALVTVIAVAMSVFHFYTAGFGLLDAVKQGAVHLAFTLSLVFLLYPISSKSAKDKIPWYDVLLALGAAYGSLYLVINFDALSARSGLPTTMDLAMGFMTMALLMEATRRISNPVLPILALLSLIYCYFGRSMPSILAHRGFSIPRIVNHMYLGTEGIFGVPLGVSSTFVFMFILFGAVLEKTGMGRFIIDLSLALAGWSTGGPAKVAVLSSGLMGTISGSSVANVCTTGMFTIPLMKSVGYKPHFAGAVEAVASTGGQIMPPVVGAGAFILAQILGVPYIEVAIAAIVPALLYYGGVLVQVHLEATRLGLKGIPRDQLPPLLPLLKSQGFLLIPLVVIVYFLLAGYTPLKAAFNGIIASYLLSFLNKDTRLTPKRLIEAFEAGARGAIGVACACATVGIVVGMATLTGLALRVAGTIIALSGGKLLNTLVLAMVSSILLGTGLPTTANFIITSMMVAPSLLQLGVPAMAAYMFVFYFGIAADLSPPVALAAYAGAGIAGSDPMKTGFTAFKLALAGFLVPYIYVYNPMILLIGYEPLPFAQAVVTAVIGIFLLGMSTIGFYKAEMSWPFRILAMIGALGLLIPGTKTDIMGLSILVVIHLWQTMKARKASS
ncbi:LOW QUALITY PROTEIN: TRAP transporter, 4TM/12TM fusion protein [Thermanaerovibrio velox DSM 12556]|uniref:TRAP transporter, 4TM/12TM fusion protein n=1 Tax=Thermanaerovibrio velox DSM 12556 TaxID=926567 RepID=H0URM3_9BACT|nr:LOW QUALITY PROTEIN: TRAP transporter, 4TM/12TM fusion protein [Thermanaerovibrio velox DSM 12556]